MTRTDDQPLLRSRLEARPWSAWISRLLRTRTTGAWLRSVAVPLGLSLLCLRSGFHDGYLLQVDIVFGPRPLPIPWGVSAPAAALVSAAVHTLGGALAGKLYAV